MSNGTTIILVISNLDNDHDELKGTIGILNKYISRLYNSKVEKLTKVSTDTSGRLHFNNGVFIANLNHFDVHVNDFLLLIESLPWCLPEEVSLLYADENQDRMVSWRIADGKSDKLKRTIQPHVVRADKSTPAYFGIVEYYRDSVPDDKYVGCFSYIGHAVLDVFIGHNTVQDINGIRHRFDTNKKVYILYQGDAYLLSDVISTKEPFVTLSEIVNQNKEKK